MFVDCEIYGAFVTDGLTGEGIPPNRDPVFRWLTGKRAPIKKPIV
jgi:hypothetical protein